MKCLINSSSPWLFYFIYVNSDDVRVFVPLRNKFLGMSLNFGNPRAIALLFILSAVILLGIIAFPTIRNWSYISHNLIVFRWLLVSIVLSVITVLFTRYSFSVDWRFYLVSFGWLAAVLGFGIQMIINGTYVAFLGSQNVSWVSHLFLGPGAAISQTFGKLIILCLILKIAPGQSFSTLIRTALLIGWMFTVTEVIFLSGKMIAANVSEISNISFIERFSVALFHIYSTVLIAVYLAKNRLSLLLLVIALHSFIDFLAGAGSSLGMSILLAEAIIFGIAAVTWITSLIVL